MARIILFLIVIALAVGAFLLLRGDGAAKWLAALQRLRGGEESLCIQLIDFRPPPALESLLPDKKERAALLRARKDPGALSGYAKLLLEDRLPDEAILCASEAISRDSEFAGAYSVRSKAYLRQNKQDLALFDAKKAVELAPDDEASLGDLGDLAVRMGLGEEAIAVGEAYAQRHPQSYLGPFFRGRGLALLGRNEEALKAFEEYAAIRKSPARDSFFRGRIYLDLGRYKDALAQFEEARKANANDPSPLNDAAIALWRGLARVLLGEPEGGLADIRASIFEHGARDPEAYYALGFGYERAADERRAKKAYEKAIINDLSLKYAPSIEPIRQSPLLEESRQRMLAYSESKLRKLPSPLLFEDEKGSND